MRLRKLTAALVLATAAIMATSGLALATSNSYTSPNVWGSAGAFGNYATFYAKWTDTRSITSTGTTWTFTNFEMDALIRGGRGCDPTYCSGWGWTFKATFYNTNGAVISTITLPAGRCYALPLISTSDLWLTRCKTSYTYHTSATSVVQLGKMKLDWSVGLLVDETIYFGNAWTYSKTLTFS